MANYLGKDLIKEVTITDKVSPQDTTVLLVSLYNEKELIDKELKEILTRKNELLDERHIAKSPEEQAKIDVLLAEYNTKEENSKKILETASSEKREVYATQTMLDACQTEEPTDEYYHNRRLLVVKEILEVLAEYGVERVELVPILQWVEQSVSDNEKKAVGKLFGKDLTDINMLDYHYALIERRTD